MRLPWRTLRVTERTGLRADCGPAGVAHADGVAFLSLGVALKAVHQLSLPGVVTASGANFLRQARAT